MSALIPPTAVIDLETTGFRPSDRVLEIGVVLLDSSLHREHSWQTLVQPRRDIDNSHVHGITATDLVGAPEFSGVAAELAELLEGRLVVAHNAPFDTRFLSAEYSRLGIALPPAQSWAVCTRRLSQRLLPGAPQKLSACLESIGVINERPHDALADAEATALLFGELARRPDISLPPVQPLSVRSVMSPYMATLTRRPIVVRRSADPSPGGWLERLSGDVPSTGVAEVDDYRKLLRAALVDEHLSQSETEQLIDRARSLGITRDEALEIHGDYLRQLAIEAWMDGVVTDEERTSIHGIAVQLGVDTGQVDELLVEPVSGESDLLELRPGDRVTFTGSLDLGRDEWEARARAAGLTVGGVTKSSALVISANPDSMSGKARKARDYAVPIVDEATFARLLRGIEPGTLEEAAVVDEPAVELAEIFPWTGELGRPVDRPDDVARAWLESFRDTPIRQMSTRLDPANLPDGLPTDGRIVTRWLQKYPRPLDASLTELADIPGFGEFRVQKVATAVVLLALDSPDRDQAREDESVGGYESIFDGEGDSGLYSEDVADSYRIDEATRVLAQWSGLMGEENRPAGIDLPSQVSDAQAVLDEDGFWSDPAGYAIRQARSEILSIIGDDPRVLDIFRNRMLGRATLEDIGARHEVTRERIRQLENQLKARLGEIRPATGLVLAALPRRFGPLAARADLLRVLPALGEESPTVGQNILRVLEVLAADWELRGQWFQKKGFDDELATALAEHADHYGVVATSRLAEIMGVDESLIRAKLAEFPESSLRVIDDHVLTRVRSYGERAAALLSIVGAPMTAQEILGALGHGHVRSMSNALSTDDSLIRLGREKWGLAEWGGEEYTTLAEWIGRRVDESGSIPLNELVAEATSLGVAPNSVRAYASAYEFQTVDGMVSRVEKIETVHADPAESAGLYVTGDGWALLTTVTYDHLRGSGTGVPRGVSAVLEIPALEKKVLDSRLGDQVVSHTRTGTAIGSIRRFLQELGSEEGDRIWITFSRSGEFNVQPASPRRPGLIGISELLNLLGLDDRVDPDDPAAMGRVNKALGLESGAPRRKTVSRFRHRGQDDIADLIAYQLHNN